MDEYEHKIYSTNWKNTKIFLSENLPSTKRDFSSVDDIIEFFTELKESYREYDASRDEIVG